MAIRGDRLSGSTVGARSRPRHAKGPPRSGRSTLCPPITSYTRGPAPNLIESRPRRAVAEGADKFSRGASSVRELVARIPAPRCDHGKNQTPALAQQLVINV